MLPAARSGPPRRVAADGAVRGIGLGAARRAATGAGRRRRRRRPRRRHRRPRAPPGRGHGPAARPRRGRRRRARADRVDTATAAWPTRVAAGQRALAHELVGVSRTMLRLAREHAVDRVQFDRPIAGFQAVRHRLADSLVAIEAADAAADRGWDDGTPLTAALAKAVAGRNARTVARHASRCWPASASPPSTPSTTTCGARWCSTTCSATPARSPRPLGEQLLRRPPPPDAAAAVSASSAQLGLPPGGDARALDRRRGVAVDRAPSGSPSCVDLAVASCDVVRCHSVHWCAVADDRRTGVVDGQRSRGRRMTPVVARARELGRRTARAALRRWSVDVLAVSLGELDARWARIARRRTASSSRSRWAMFVLGVDAAAAELAPATDVVDDSTRSRGRRVADILPISACAPRRQPGAGLGRRRGRRRGSGWRYFQRLWKPQPPWPLSWVVSPPLEASWMWSISEALGDLVAAGVEAGAVADLDGPAQGARKKRRCGPTSSTRERPSNTMRSTSASVRYGAAVPGVSTVRLNSSRIGPQQRLEPDDHGEQRGRAAAVGRGGAGAGGHLDQGVGPALGRGALRGRGSSARDRGGPWPRPSRPRTARARSRAGWCRRSRRRPGRGSSCRTTCPRSSATGGPRGRRGRRRRPARRRRGRRSSTSGRTPP